MRRYAIHQNKSCHSIFDQYGVRHPIFALLWLHIDLIWGGTSVPRNRERCRRLTPNQKANMGIFCFLWRQSKILANWIWKKFNCTAEVKIQFLEPNQQSSPCKLRFCETQDIERDQHALCNFCQIHKCNDYCMRQPKDETANKETTNQTKMKTNKVRQTQCKLTHWT
jgi:hypothetical protein